MATITLFCRIIFLKAEHTCYIVNMVTFFHIIAISHLSRNKSKDLFKFCKVKVSPCQSPATRSVAKGTIGFLGVRLSVCLSTFACQHDCAFSFDPINFKFYIHTLWGLGRNPIDFGHDRIISWGSRAPAPLKIQKFAVSTIAPSIFVQSISNLLCVSIMTSGRTLLNFVLIGWALGVQPHPLPHVDYII